MPDFTLHRITAQTTALLARVAEDVFDDTIDPAHVAAYVAAGDHALYVAVRDGVVIGQARAVLHRQPDSGADIYIDNLGVAPDAKRQGVATALVDALVAWGKAATPCRSVWVATEPDNAEANGFYAAHGFTLASMAYYSKDFE